MLLCRRFYRNCVVNGRATNCLRVLVSRVGIVGGTIVRWSFEIQRLDVSNVFACLCVVLGLTLETRVSGKRPDQSVCKEIRLIRSLARYG